MRAWVHVFLTLCAFGAWGGNVARAQSALHEFIPEAGRDQDLVAVAGGHAANAFVYQGQVISAPRGGALRADERAMRAQNASSGPSYRPDFITDFKGKAGYYEVFTPSITPYKRVSAVDEVRFDADGRTPYLAAREGGVRPVEVEGAGAPPPDARPRDRFWASVVLDFSAGRRVPLPSVSPESRILSLETEPYVDLRIERDASDNFYAVAVGQASEPVRVVFLTDAPRSYFGAPIPAGPAPAGAPRLPPEVERDALAFARSLGLTPGDDARDVLSVLVRHFRSFEESAEPPPAGRSVFLSLATGMRGVCRHRAYGFVITALALGLHARFAMNEAHSWVEAHVPVLGWMRVDLGGAATALDAKGVDDRPKYEAENPDPFPRPAAYLDALRLAQAHFRATHPSSTTSEGSALGTSSASSPGSAGDNGDGLTDVAGRDLRAGDLTIRVDRTRYDVYRGRTLEVSGRVVDPDGNGVGALRVELWLEGPAAKLLGVTATQGNGVFQASVGVSPDEAAGEYRLGVRTPGNERFGPAEAR
ncbi:MAG: transglutaminase-like domain-containing protein [Polyangiales bacterium]